MKQNLLFKTLLVLAAMLMVGTKMQAAEPKSYAVQSEDHTVLTFFYDDLYENYPTSYIFEGGFEAPKWYEWCVKMYNGRWPVRTIVFDESFANCKSITSTRNWFYEFYLGDVIDNIIGIENLKTSNVTDMSYMFYGCRYLKNLDLSSFDTSKVTDMSYMFYECQFLENLDLSGFDTSNVTDMSYMFYQCGNVENLDLSSFDTSNVTNMSHMFDQSNVPTSSNLSGFDTSKVTDMSWMFSGSAIESLDLSSFDTSKVTDMTYMFALCPYLHSIDLSSFIVGEGLRICAMFFDSKVLKTIYVSERWNENLLNHCDSHLDPDQYHLDTFKACSHLVGGAGTFYIEPYYSSRYARIDDPENGKPGYFTYKSATGIERVTTNSDQRSGPAYDLSGRQLENPQKGINIINGKKVIVK